MPRYEGSFNAGLDRDTFLKRTEENGWILESDMSFLSTIYRDLSGKSEGTALLTDIVNIPVWDANEQKALKKEITGEVEKYLSEQKINEVKEEPKQEEVKPGIAAVMVVNFFINSKKRLAFSLHKVL